MPAKKEVMTSAFDFPLTEKERERLNQDKYKTFSKRCTAEERKRNPITGRPMKGREGLKEFQKLHPNKALMDIEMMEGEEE